MQIGIMSKCNKPFPIFYSLFLQSGCIKSSAKIKVSTRMNSIRNIQLNVGCMIN